MALWAGNMLTSLNVSQNMVGFLHIMLGFFFFFLILFQSIYTPPHTSIRNAAAFRKDDQVPTAAPAVATAYS